MFYKQHFSKNLSVADITAVMQNEGFAPQLITDSPGFIYESHTHPETKYIACISGSMQIIIDTQEYLFEPGDKMVIAAYTPHKAIVGKQGCVYLWSEKIV